MTVAPREPVLSKRADCTAIHLPHHRSCTTDKNYVNSGTTYTRKKTLEIRLLLKDGEEGWILVEPDFTPRYGYDGGYIESNVPGVEVKHDSQSPDTTNVGYKVTQKIFEFYDEVIVLTWKRDLESSAVNCSETTRVKNATADRVISEND